MAVGVRCRVAEVVRERGMSWRDLARRAGVAEAAVRRLRTPTANPSLALAARVADALGESLEALWALRG